MSDSASWVPTHEVPAGGMPAWDHPDPATPVTARFPAGLGVVVLADGPDDEPWQQVRAADGRVGWVDGTRLVAVEAASADPPARSTTRSTPTVVWLAIAVVVVAVIAAIAVLA